MCHLTTRTHILADRFCMEALPNQLIDLSRDYARNFYIGSDSLALLVNKSPPRASMTEFTLVQIAYELKVTGFGKYAEVNDTLYRNFLGQSAKNSKAILQKVLAMPPRAKSQRLPLAHSSHDSEVQGKTGRGRQKERK